jgi:hypothetical protein
MYTYICIKKLWGTVFLIQKKKTNRVFPFAIWFHFFGTADTYSLFTISAFKSERSTRRSFQASSGCRREKKETKGAEIDAVVVFRFLSRDDTRPKEGDCSQKINVNVLLLPLLVQLLLWIMMPLMLSLSLLLLLLLFVAVSTYYYCCCC